LIIHKLFSNAGSPCYKVHVLSKRFVEIALAFAYFYARYRFIRAFTLGFSLCSGFGSLARAILRVRSLVISLSSSSFAVWAASPSMPAYLSTKSSPVEVLHPHLVIFEFDLLHSRTAS
jgi:hypothetical protein